MTSRDNARTPMQWSDDKYAGFSLVKPIQKEISNYSKINVKNQLIDERSILRTYQKLIHLRRFSEYSDTLIFGKFKLIQAEHEDVFAYERTDQHKKIVVIANFRPHPVTFDYYDGKDIIYTNYNRVDCKVYRLEPFEALILEVNHD